MLNRNACLQQLIQTLQEQSRSYFLRAVDTTSGAIDAIHEIEKEIIDARRAQDDAFIDPS